MDSLNRQKRKRNPFVCSLWHQGAAAACGLAKRTLESERKTSDASKGGKKLFTTTF